MDSLEHLVAAELAEPVDPRVTAMASALAALYPSAARAILFYGSCLRERALDGLMLDFYLIVSDYRAAYGRGWLAAGNRLVPPNVFPFAHEGLAAKYAVLSEADFRKLNGPAARTVSIWARFAQPSRLVWSADAQARTNAAGAITQAAPTLLTHAMAHERLRREGPVAALDLWRTGFELTFGAELRAERRQRPRAMVDAEPDRYARFTGPALARTALTAQDRDGLVEFQFTRETAARTACAWPRLRRNGKAVTVLRLLKASFTFANGIDYLAWKLNRHAGTSIEVRPWQRRWPLVAALILLPRLLKRGAVR